MQKQLLLLLCTLQVLLALAGNTNGNPPRSTLKGKVIDASGKPLAGAVIQIHDARISAVTNSEGLYTTPSFTIGRYLVEASFVGYSTAIETLDIIEGTTIRNFTLQPSVAEYEGVTVTGVASAIRLKQSPQPITVVQQRDLLQNPGTNIIDGLSKIVPGVAAIATGPAISKPVIRGLGYNRLVVLNDGVRQEGQQWGDEHGIEIDEYSVQKVEVLKGPASLMYGSDAMAGVVNLMTNTPVEQGTIKANLQGTVMSNNGLLGSYANIAGHLNNGFNWNVYGSTKSAKDYQNKYDGRVFNSRYNEKNFGGYLGINKHWGYSHLLISNVNQKLGIVEGERDDATGKFINTGSVNEDVATDDNLNSRSMVTPYQHIRHFKIATDNNFAIGKTRLLVNIGYQLNRRTEYGDPAAPTTPELAFRLHTITYNLTLQLPEVKGWKTSLGITVMQQQNQNRAEEVIIPAYKQFDIGLFYYARKTFNKLTLSGGVRGDYRDVSIDALQQNGEQKFEQFSGAFSNVSGSMGISYEASKTVTLKANLARGYRAPTVAELASNGAHEGTNRYEHGDYNLKTETSFQADAGVEVNTQHISFSANVFYNNIHNYIYYRKLSAVNGGDSLINVDGQDITAFQFSQASATLMGFEANIDIHPHPLDWLHFENTLSYVRGRFNQSFEGSDKLPFIPPFRWQSELRANIRKAGNVLHNLYIKAEMDYAATQNSVFTAYNTETPTQGYTLLNTGLGTDIMNGSNKLFSIYLALNNITNVAYQNHLSRLKYTATNLVTGRNGVFNMGRNFSVKVNVPLSFKL
jgi:iron complex outermembrane receptor protein